MARGQHEAVAVEPVRVRGVVLHHPRVEQVGERCEGHRRARVTGVGLLHGIHRERPDRVDARSSIVRVSLASVVMPLPVSMSSRPQYRDLRSPARRAPSADHTGLRATARERRRWRAPRAPAAPASAASSTARSRNRSAARARGRRRSPAHAAGRRSRTRRCRSPACARSGRRSAARRDRRRARRPRPRGPRRGRPRPAPAPARCRAGRSASSVASRSSAWPLQ